MAGGRSTAKAAAFSTMWEAAAWQGAAASPKQLAVLCEGMAGWQGSTAPPQRLAVLRERWRRLGRGGGTTRVPVSASWRGGVSVGTAALGCKQALADVEQRMADGCEEWLAGRWEAETAGCKTSSMHGEHGREF